MDDNAGNSLSKSDRTNDPTPNPDGVPASASSPPPSAGVSARKIDWGGFDARALEARAEVERMRSPLLVNHYDCDGLSSGAIVCAFLESRGLAPSAPDSPAQPGHYRVHTVRKVDDALISQLAKEEEIIFTDLGGGSPRVSELSAHVVVYDHHQTKGLSHLQLNPHLFSIDGGTELCGATTTYWSLRTLPEAAIVGAVGDMQYPLVGANRLLLDELSAKGIVQAPIDLRFYGRMSRPLPQLLAFADDPFLPGLGGSEERCAQFLENIGLGKKEADGATSPASLSGAPSPFPLGALAPASGSPASLSASPAPPPYSSRSWRTYAQLDEAEKKKLVSALALYLAEISGGQYRAERLVGETYLFPRLAAIPELYDAGEFSTLLNACGRHNQPQVGIDVCLGRAGALEQARALLAAHRRALREGVEYAYKNTRDFGPFLFLDGRGLIDDGIIGVVAGMLYPGGRKKPVLAVACEESGKIKISTRGTKKLVAEGLNLGLALSQTCPLVGGVGGGHAIAAGASIPPDKLDEFLKSFAQQIEAQTREARE